MLCRRPERKRPEGEQCQGTDIGEGDRLASAVLLVEVSSELFDPCVRATSFNEETCESGEYRLGVQRGSLRYVAGLI